MADCTSVAAASIPLLKSNWSVIWVLPCELVLVVRSRPGIWVNCFSSGVAMVFAIVSGFAPGYETLTWITG